MTRNDFKDGSISQLIFDYWDGKLQKTTDFEDALKEISKEEFIEFIMDAQCKGWFKGHLHE